MTNTQIKSFIIIFAIYYAQAYNELAGPISESLRLCSGDELLAALCPILLA